MLNDKRGFALERHSTRAGFTAASTGAIGATPAGGALATFARLQRIFRPGGGGAVRFSTWTRVYRRWGVGLDGTTRVDGEGRGRRGSSGSGTVLGRHKTIWSSKGDAWLRGRPSGTPTSIGGCLFPERQHRGGGRRRVADGNGRDGRSAERLRNQGITPSRRTRRARRVPCQGGRETPAAVDILSVDRHATVSRVVKCVNRTSEAPANTEPEAPPTSGRTRGVGCRR